MKKKLFPMIFSFLLVFTLFVGVPVMQASASNADSSAEIQQKSKTVTVTRYFSSFPPATIFYNSGGYEGYLGLSSYSKTGSTYRAIYIGRVYDGPPYPIPTSHSTLE